jgi:pilus assembly protein CpaC
MRKWLALVILVIFVAEQAPLLAAGQQQAAFGNGATPGANSATSATTIDLLVGRSTLLNVGATIARISLTVPDIADALVTSPQQLLIHGKKPGTISLFVWDRSGGIKTYEVAVRRDLSALGDQLRALFPGEPIGVHGSGKDVVLSGTVSSKYVVEKAAEVAAGYADGKDGVVNLLKQQEGVASNQVLLRVRFAEVSRSALQELGASFFTGPGGFHDYVSRVSTSQFPSVNFDEMTRTSIQGPPEDWGGGRDQVTATGGRMTFSDFLNIFLFNNKYNVGTVIRALSEKGLFQSLAEPNLVATNGKEASFLAGGEYPYPVVQGGGANTSVTITFKEFGIRLKFTPTILGDEIINLKVEPEVSALDFSNAVTIEGFRIPALSTRRTQTEVELRDGQTFAVAGLLNNTLTTSLRKIPGIGDIPILGWLFKSKALQKNETELVVIITPHILRRGSPGAATGLPNMVEPFLGKPDKQVSPPPAHLGSPRYPTQGQQGPKGPASPAEAAGAATDGTAPTMAPMPAPVARPVANPTAPARPTQPPTTAPAAAPVQKPVVQPQPQSQPQPQAQPIRMEPAQSAPNPNAPRTAAAPSAPAAAATAAPMSKEEQKRLEAASKKTSEDRKRAEELASKQAIADAKRAKEERKEAEQRAKEQAKRDSADAKKAEELRKKQAEEDAKRNKAIAEAAARLKEAQAEYQSAVQKTNAEKKPQGQK